MRFVRTLLEIVRREKSAQPAPAANGRTRLPDRRPAIRQRMKWSDSRGDEHVAHVSFGFDREGAVREVFCQAKKEGSDMQGLVHDACIAVSRCLQRGDRIAEIARSLGELREEDQETGRPASVIGALARLGAAVEAEIQGGLA